MDDEAQWQYVAEHLKAIRSTLGVIAFVVVLSFLFALVGVLVRLSDSGTF